MTSKAHQFKNAMRVYAAELICSTGVLGFQTFKLGFFIFNKLHSHAESSQYHQKYKIYVYAKFWRDKQRVL